jgi:hypothetical protein
MKTDEPRDDEILGRALSRAIETAEVNETPYERSRIGLRPPKRGTSFWRVAAVAATIVIAGALGSALIERPAADEPVGQQPSPTVAPGNTPATTVAPATPAPRPNAIDHGRIYVSRLDLPPVAFAVPITGPTAEQRIAARVTALRALRQDQAPPGTQNLLWNNAFQGGVQVVITGDLATVDLLLEKPWTTSGSAASHALLQQLVYTATEEPGIRRVLFTENGGKRMTIDQIVIDKPLSRENVSGYVPVRNEGGLAETVSRACAPSPCPSPAPIRLSNTYSVDSIAPGVTRFVVQAAAGDLTDFNVKGYDASDDVATAWSSKYVFSLELKGTEIKPGLEIIDRTPLRSVRSTVLDPAVGGGTRYELALDDLRPWRLAVLRNPDRIVVDFGGNPSAISDTVAVYSPKAGDTGREFTVSGLSRTFEATTSWRVVDAARRVLASGFTQASLGTSAAWGTFQTSIVIPASSTGSVTLEVYWASPRDGADTGLVQIPLTVR